MVREGHERVRNNRVFKSASEFRQAIDDFFAKWPQIAHSMIDRIRHTITRGGGYPNGI